jgi:two-component system response regulator PilR (NtrC family)
VNPDTPKKAQPQPPRVLVVDDEADIRELLEITLSRMGVDSTPAGSVAEALAYLETRPFDLCLVDMRLPDGNGIEIVRHVAEAHADTPVAMITAHGNMQTAIEALKAGAFDFVSKPVDLGVLRRLVDSALRLDRSGNGPATQADKDEDGELIGKSPAIQATRRLIDKLARNQAPVFVSGESGTGKELAARAIHARSPRSSRPFVAVNCGAIPQDLMESELFGHIKGSFTGALRDKPGLFQAADGGTLFLDEVADLPLSMQVKLLRAIQEKAVRPVGAEAEIPVDVRIISASHKDLAAMVAAGDFRQDLFYRIHVIELVMAPLRDRPEDIPPTIEHILRRLAARTGESRPRLEPDALRGLMGYHYPGNVRELENILERATALCDGGVLRLEDLQLQSAASPIEAVTSIPEGPPHAGTQDLETYLADVERRAVLQALEQTRWNKTAAAKRLGITFRALRYRLEKLGLDEPTGSTND